MKETIAICKRNENGSLTVIAEKKLTVTLKESDMTLTTRYNRKEYTVMGSCLMSFIVIG